MSAVVRVVSKVVGSVVDAVGDIAEDVVSSVGDVVEEVGSGIAHVAETAINHAGEIAVIAAVVYTGGAAAGAWGAAETAVATAATAEVATAATVAATTTATASGVAGMMGMSTGVLATAVNGAALNAGLTLVNGGGLDDALKSAVKGAVLSGAGAYVSKGIDTALASSVTDGSIGASTAKAISSIGANTAVGTVANGGDIGKALEGSIKQQVGSSLAGLAKTGVADALESSVGNRDISVNAANALSTAAAGGVQAGLAGNSVWEGAAASGLSRYAGSTIKDFLTDAGAGKNVTSSLSKAGSAAASAAVYGNDPFKAALATGATSYIGSTVKDWTDSDFLASIATSVAQDQLGFTNAAGQYVKTSARPSRVVTPDGKVQIIDPTTGLPPTDTTTGGGTPANVTGGMTDADFMRAFEEWVAKQGGDVASSGGVTGGVDATATPEYTTLYGGAPRSVNEIDQISASNKIAENPSEYDFQGDLVNFLTSLQNGVGATTGDASTAAQKDALRKQSSKPVDGNSLNTVVGGAYSGNQAKGFDTFKSDDWGNDSQLASSPVNGFYG